MMTDNCLSGIFVYMLCYIVLDVKFQLYYSIGCNSHVHRRCKSLCEYSSVDSDAWKSSDILYMSLYYTFDALI